MEIEYVNYGLGNKIGDKIYINKILQDNPLLLKKVLTHEIKHFHGPHNIDYTEPADKDLFMFCLSHPSTWVQFIPIWVISGRKIIYSKIMLLLWAFIISWLFLLYAVIRWII